MNKTDIISIKIENLKMIKSIVCDDCKEYHHIGKEFFKILKVPDKDINIIIKMTKKKFKKFHCNHNVEIKEISPYPIEYNQFIIPFVEEFFYEF